MGKRKRKPKSAYCISCGWPLKRSPGFEESCTMRCAADASYVLQRAGAGLDNEHCNLCGVWVGMCECVSIREKYSQGAEAFGYVPCEEEEE